jgi:hypothetical protein
MAELSTPFMNFRWYLRIYNKHRSLLFVVNEIVFTVIFFFSRIVAEFYVVYEFVKFYDIMEITGIKAEHPIYSVVQPILMLIMITMNGYWFVNLLRVTMKSIRRYGAPVEPAEKKKEM